MLRENIYIYKSHVAKTTSFSSNHKKKYFVWEMKLLLKTKEK